MSAAGGDGHGHCPAHCLSPGTGGLGTVQAGGCAGDFCRARLWAERGPSSAQPEPRELQKGLRDAAESEASSLWDE